MIKMWHMGWPKSGKYSLDKSVNAKSILAESRPVVIAKALTDVKAPQRLKEVMEIRKANFCT